MNNPKVLGGAALAGTALVVAALIWLIMPGSGTLKITSSPRGADVIVDDSKVGVTPEDGSKMALDLSGGEHEIRLVKAKDNGFITHKESTSERK